MPQPEKFRNLLSGRKAKTETMRRQIAEQKEAAMGKKKRACDHPSSGVYIVVIVSISRKNIHGS